LIIQLEHRSQALLNHRGMLPFDKLPGKYEPELV
jgi:hypothetical protein